MKGGIVAMLYAAAAQHLGLLEDGSNFNVVPAHSWFTLDDRFNPEEDLHTELAHITETINGTPYATFAARLLAIQ